MPVPPLSPISITTHTAQIAAPPPDSEPIPVAPIDPGNPASLSYSQSASAPPSRATDAPTSSTLPETFDLPPKSLAPPLLSQSHPQHSKVESIPKSPPTHPLHASSTPSHAPATHPQTDSHPTNAQTSAATYPFAHPAETHAPKSPPTPGVPQRCLHKVVPNTNSPPQFRSIPNTIEPILCPPPHYQIIAPLFSSLLTIS